MCLNSTACLLPKDHLPTVFVCAGRCTCQRDQGLQCLRQHLGHVTAGALFLLWESSTPCVYVRWGLHKACALPKLLLST